MPEDQIIELPISDPQISFLRVQEKSKLFPKTLTFVPGNITCTINANGTVEGDLDLENIEVYEANEYHMILWLIAQVQRLNKELNELKDVR